MHNASDSEAYRLRRLATLVHDCRSVVDLGFAQCPNAFLHNPRVIGLDVASVDCPENYDVIYRSDFLEMSTVLVDESVDAIIAGEVLEHLHAPLDFLRRCRLLLPSGGKLVLSTPNPNSPIERLLTLWLSRRWYYTDDHITLYPQRWLIRLLELGGFTDVRLYSGGFPVPGLGLVPCPRPWCYQTIAEAYAQT